MLSCWILGLFIVVSIVHLIGCWNGYGKLSAATKPMLVLLLLFYYVSCDPVPLNWRMAGALFASWLGDVLLMPHGDGWFTAGGIAFVAAHAFFVLVYARQIRFDALPRAMLVTAAAAYIGAAAAVSLRIGHQAPGWMRVPILFYLLCNTAMNLFALAQWKACPGWGPAVAYIGAVLFFISDCVLFLAKFDPQRERFRKAGFVIMLTYILGEMLITLGMIAIDSGGL